MGFKKFSNDRFFLLRLLIPFELSPFYRHHLLRNHSSWAPFLIYAVSNLPERSRVIRDQACYVNSPPCCNTAPLKSSLRFARRFPSLPCFLPFLFCAVSTTRASSPSWSSLS